MTPRGLEQADVTSSNSKGLGESPESGGALSGAEKPISGHFSPDLQQVIDAWPTLPDAVKTAIVVKVRSAVNSKGERVV